MPLGQRVVLIGGGHNALVAAFYLAQGGFKPLVLERREMVGGGAITEEFYPGFRASTLAHTVGPLRADILRDMQLQRFSCEILSPDPRVFAPTPEGQALFFCNDHRETATGIANFSQKDAAKYAAFVESLESISEVLAQLVSMTPPAIDRPSPEDFWNLFKTGRGVRRLGKDGIFNLLRWAPMAIADFAAEFFETELLRAVIAARGIFGNALGPWSAGSTAVLLLRVAADAHPVGSSAFPRGGLGTLTRVLAESAKEAGAEIRTDAEVERIRIKNGAVVGVVLKDGEEIAAKAIVSGVDPKRTFFHLIDPLNLDPVFTNRLKNFRARGTAAKVNLALGGLPGFSALETNERALRALSGRIHIGPDIDYLERAFDDSKYGELSQAPYLDVTIPTILDPALAPDGKHVLSAYVQFAPYQ
ncbi:MAG TPA: NAD(P)/FAD-dependent oxidoreductase, partial [Candidatus Dormibacteraeota bacterium]|nr:NAD(P)/FAD-dependent oxidoreductase [Candidatus Dormibacteraeota bacterium]